MIKKYPDTVAKHNEMLEASEKLVEYMDATTTLWLSLHWQCSAGKCVQAALSVDGSSGIVRAQSPPYAALDAPRSLFRESLVVRHLARQMAQPRFEARAEELPPALFRGACFHEAWKRA